MFGNLGSGKHDYDDLVKALEERFAPPNQTELYRVQLRERRQKASESMAELGQDIRHQTNLAYPKAPSDVRVTLVKEQFVDSLVNTEMRLNKNIIMSSFKSSRDIQKKEGGPDSCFG